MSGKTIYGLLALMVLGIVAAGAVYAMPHAPWHDNELAQEALGNNDYTAFVSALSNDTRNERFIEHLNEERFGDIVQRHEQHEAVNAAVDSKDFDAWVAAMQNDPRAQELLLVVNEDNFDTFVEHFNARELGDHETARELAEELGLPKPQGQHGDCDERPPRNGNVGPNNGEERPQQGQRQGPPGGRPRGPPRAGQQ